MKLFATLLLLAMITSSSFAADGPVRHVVHFKFKADATPGQVKAVTDAFAALKDKISVVESFEWGTNMSKEGFDKGYSHCWLVSFKNAADRDAYLIHPAHTAFVEVLKPILEDAVVVDFIAGQ